MHNKDVQPSLTASAHRWMVASLLHHQMQDGNHLLLGGDEIALGLDHHFLLLYDTLVRPEL